MFIAVTKNKNRFLESIQDHIRMEVYLHGPCTMACNLEVRYESQYCARKL